MSLSRLSKRNRFFCLVPKSRKRLDTNLSSAVQEILEADAKVPAKVKYPKVKPIFPPGKWGKLSREVAWKRYDKEKELRHLATVRQRLDYYRKLGSPKYGIKVWHYKPLSYFPNILQFQQDATKSVLVEKSLPDVYGNHDMESEITLLEPLVKEILLLHYENLNTKYIKNAFLKYNQDEAFAKNVQRQILDTVISVFAHKYPHLWFGILTEKAKIEAYWDRYGIERIGFKRVDKSAYKPRHIPKTPEEVTFIGCPGFEESSEITSEFTASFQLRSDKPLPEFLPRTDTLCMEAEYPQCRYYLSKFGQKFSWKKLDFIAGYNVASKGTPFKFSQVSLLNTNNYHMVDYEKRVGMEQAVMTRKGYGLNASFLVALAQAYFHGFNPYIDLTYPMTTQTIVTDGKKFSFNAYQLNTTALWKCDESHPVRNVWWHIPEADLYDVVENGEVKGFNNEVLKNILKFLLLEPVDRGYELRPAASKIPDCVEKKYLRKKPRTIVEDEKDRFDLS